MKKDFGSKVTHLVAKSVSGPKYRVCLDSMTETWRYQSILIAYT